MTKALQKRSVCVLACVLIALLCIKYFRSFFAFPGVPFGYDAGIYRYLFLNHAHALPPFTVAPMPPWAASHPLGLFFFSTLLLRIGVPVDWLIGWVWNVFPMILSGVLAILFARRNGTKVGLLMLLVSLLSTVQYQGFLMMYWKVFVALLWCVFAFDAFERKSKLWMIFGMLAIATHQQIGLIYVLSVLASVVSRCKQRSLLVKNMGLCVASLALGLLWYLPNFSSALGGLFPLLAASLSSLLTLCILFLAFTVLAVFTVFPKYGHAMLLVVCGLVGLLLFLLPLAGIAPGFLYHVDAIPGAFFTIPEYLERSLPLLLLGMFGFFATFTREKGSVWQWAVLFCALAVVSMFFFYRRFLLPLDFFLLPFSAFALARMFLSRDLRLKIGGAILIALQSWLLIGQLRSIDPHVDRAMLDSFASLRSVIEPKAAVVVLDLMAPWVAGYLPESDVSGPGIFDSQPLPAWEKFLYGSSDDRRAFIEHYPRGSYFYATDVFRSYYPPEVQTLFSHACLQPTGALGLYRSVCGF